MTPATADPPYPLGDTSAEHARLIRQAAIWDPFTERLFREAGIDFPLDVVLLCKETCRTRRLD